ncbi:hypothetical protein GCM10023083_69770 [Streptomyces phyllanthi]
MNPVHRGWRRAAFAAVTSAALVVTLFGGGTAQAADRPSAQQSTIEEPAAGKGAVVPEKELRDRLVAAARETAERQTEEAAGAGTEGARRTPFVIGGETTTTTAAPWMVQLGYYNPFTGESFFCGGALVAADKVLTAAHCVDGADWTLYGTVLAGATDLDDYESGTVAGVWRQWQHPSYNADTLRNDIAVLTLTNPMEQKWLRLAASNDSSLYTPGRTGTVYGWGLTSGGDDADLSAQLRKASLPMVKDSTCDTAMKNLLGADYFAEGKGMVCAGTPASGADEGTKSPCNGDSGGPLVVDNKIAGIVSWGVSGCTAKGAYPVFTKVSHYAAVAQPRVDDADWTVDGRADLLMRTSSGAVYYRASQGTSLAARASVSSDWTGVPWALQADLDRDGFVDLVIKDTDGKVYWNHTVHSTLERRWTRITSVPGTYKSYAVPGDVSGDGRPDLVAVDSSGNAYLHPGKGDGEFLSRTKFVSTSWKNNKVYGHGDFSGDGKADLLTRDAGNNLWLSRGTGKASAPFSARIKVRTGWKFTAIATTGDFNGDGKADVLARTSGGTLYLYPGTGKASTGIFGTRKSLGTGFNQYNLLF